MHLHLKDPETVHLAQTIAQITGETLAQAVQAALRERLNALQRRQHCASVDELLQIAHTAAALARRPYPDHAELLYDERGLPK